MAAQDKEFSAFVRVSWQRLYRTAYLLVGDHGLAEDLVQTSLAKLYPAWGRIRNEASIDAYARTIVINTAHTWFRRHGWNLETVTDDWPEPIMNPEPDDTSLTMAALRKLPPGQRAVIVLRFYEDLSVDQTAQALNLSTGTVKSQTSHALTKLRALLGDAINPVTEGAHHD